MLRRVVDREKREAKRKKREAGEARRSERFDIKKEADEVLAMGRQRDDDEVVKLKGRRREDGGGRKEGKRREVEVLVFPEMESESDLDVVRVVGKRRRKE